VTLEILDGVKFFVLRVHVIATHEQSALLTVRLASFTNRNNDMT